MQTFFGKGKLLLTGEYFVLDGALALALPCRLGQHLTITPQNDGLIHKKSVDNSGKCWYLGDFDLKSFKILQSDDEATSQRLQQIFQVIRAIQPDFLQNSTGVQIQTELDFPRDWGLGTSSTLIYTLAQWAGINPFLLLEKTFGGSGYDIACAGAEGAIFYQKNNQNPTWQPIDFNPLFTSQLYFVYLGKKQNSREGIARYRAMNVGEDDIQAISEISQAIVKTNTLKAFEQLINEHEDIVADTLQLTKAKDLYFQDYWGSIKSLGAWGGDFVLATSTQSPDKTKNYFNEKGFQVVLTYEELIYQKHTTNLQ